MAFTALGRAASLMADGWNMIDPAHVDPEAEWVYRAWREWARRAEEQSLQIERCRAPVTAKI